MCTTTPFDYNSTPTAMSCQLALLEMSRFTVINLLALLLEQSIMEGASVIRKQRLGCLLQHVFH